MTRPGSTTRGVRLRFEADLEHQNDALQAIVDTFAAPGVLGWKPAIGRNDGQGPVPWLDGPALRRSLTHIQARSGLPHTPSLDPTHPQLSVAMETGTGKTYTFLRTIHALHQAHGLSAFVLVVPSLAVRAGVQQALRATEDHFAQLFGGARIHGFVYDGRNLGAVRAFATSEHLQLMVATVQALYRSHNRIFHQEREDLGGRRPIDLVSARRPVLLVDEPQSVDGSTKGREALRGLHPLFTLRWSATHIDAHPLVYRLGPAEAFRRGLVKAVEVAPAVVPGGHGRPFVRLEGLHGRGKARMPRLELDCAGPAASVVRQTRVVPWGGSLEQCTGRDVYRGWSVRAAVGGGKAGVTLVGPTAVVELSVGATYGDVDLHALHRQMIRRTISVHLDRKQRLAPRGIKVLSLFFVDRVQSYRGAPSLEGPTTGRLSRVFEAEYRAALAERGLPAGEPSEVHGGYFSQDRRSGTWVDSTETTVAGRRAMADVCDLILRDKARLLSADCPLEFVFSHSALREGWDNPNVFQICALRDVSSERQRRQILGRGLRLCVGPHGRRVEASRTEAGLNVLTVIASEGVRSYAAGLQREYASDSNPADGLPIPVRPAGRAVLLPLDPRLRSNLHVWASIEGRWISRIALETDAFIRDCVDGAGPPTLQTSPSNDPPPACDLGQVQQRTGLTRDTVQRVATALETAGHGLGTSGLVRRIQAALRTRLRHGVVVSPIPHSPHFVLTLDRIDDSHAVDWTPIPPDTWPPVSTPLGTLVPRWVHVTHQEGGPCVRLRAGSGAVENGRR